MASRRDLIQSFQFAARRVVSAVVLRQTDPREWPFRRLGGAGVATVMLTVVALGAVGVYGMIFPGGKTSWRDGRSVIIDKRTGASYVFIAGALHPVANFTSAALLVGTTATTSTASASLAEVPHGGEVGIQGAPSTLPTPKDLVSPPWSLCTEQVPDESGTLVSRTRLVAGRSPGMGRRPGDAALLVVDSTDQRRYLIWRDTRYLLTDAGVDRVALRLDNQVTVTVGDAWLQSLPAGRKIGPIPFRAAGRPSVALPGATVGQLFRVVTPDQGTQYYLANSRLLNPISELQAQIQIAAGASATSLSPASAAAARKAPPRAVTAADPPIAVPAYVRPRSASTVVCSAYRDGSFAPQVLVDSQIPAGGGVVTPGTGPDGAVFADRIWLPPGKAALVAALPSPQSASGPLYLVTDAGRRYAIPSQEVLRSLALSGAPVSRLPASLLVRVPEGPALDPAAAGQALADDTLAR